MATKNGENLLYQDLTYQIRGACFEVWKKFGGVFKEKVIDRALTKELNYRGLKVENQKVITILYKGEKIGTYIPDKIVNDLILLEIKAKPCLTRGDERQFWYYLRGSDYKVGLLINFGSEKLEVKRRIYDKARQKAIRVNPRSYPRKSASISKGFTILELVVTMLIIAILSAVLFLGTSKEEGKLALQRAALILAQDLRETQEMAMGAKEVDCPPEADIPLTRIFGINFSKTGGAESDWQKEYAIFGECKDPPNYAYNNPNADKNIRTISLVKGVKVCSISSPPPPNKLNIAFKAPDPTVYINCDPSEGCNPLEPEEAAVTFCLEADQTQTKKVKINTAGRIEVE